MTNTKINYTQQGDYLLPNLKLPKQQKCEIGVFGLRHKNYLLRYHKISYYNLLTSGKLVEYLSDMPVRESYSDRVFTTSVMSYPELVHIGEDKDFTPVIEKAIECGGYDEDKEMRGMNGGNTVTTGFAHNAVLSNADKIVDLNDSDNWNF